METFGQLWCIRACQGSHGGCCVAKPARRRVQLVTVGASGGAFLCAMRAVPSSFSRETSQPRSKQLSAPKSKPSLQLHKHSITSSFLLTNCSLIPSSCLFVLSVYLHCSSFSKSIVVLSSSYKPFILYFPKRPNPSGPSFVRRRAIEAPSGSRSGRQCLVTLLYNPISS